MPKRVSSDHRSATISWPWLEAEVRMEVVNAPVPISLMLSFVAIGSSFVARADYATSGNPVQRTFLHPDALGLLFDRLGKPGTLRPTKFDGMQWEIIQPKDRPLFDDHNRATPFEEKLERLQEELHRSLEKAIKSLEDKPRSNRKP
jgi:hypothetical protein